MLDYKTVCNKYEDLKKENNLNRKEIKRLRGELKKLQKENEVLLSITYKNRKVLNHDKMRLFKN